MNSEVVLALQKFAAGQIDALELQRSLSRELELAPGAAPEVLAAIAAAKRTGTIGAEAARALSAWVSSTISRGPRSRSPATEAAPDAPTLMRAAATHMASQPAPPDGRQRRVGAKEGATLKGRYRLEKQLGSGGMGVVFRARDLEEERIGGEEHEVAIKVLLPDFRDHPDALRSLYEEVRKTRELAHPNIVGVYDCQQDGEQVFMTMQYLEGKTLEVLLDEDFARGMPWERARPMIEGMGSALAYAHDRGVIHCDFKPSNVFVTLSGVAKVLDFGIARAVRRGQRRFDPGALGALTPAYASPEMIRSWQDRAAQGGPVAARPDPRDDIYALACVVFELLTGRHPFDRKNAEQARQERLTCAPVPGLSAQQNGAIAKAMAFDREHRTARVEEFLTELVSAPAARRRRWPSAVATAAVLAAIIAVGYFAKRVGENGPVSTSTVQSVSPAQTTISEKSIAVMPFVDMSEKKDQEYFSDGLSEELIDLLARVPDLRVPARTSSFYFKGKQVTIAQIAQALSVAHLLEGSVRKAGNTIRVTAQLVRADNGYHLWSDTYDRDLKDVFKVQDEIAGAVVSALKVKLAPGQQAPNAHRTSNPEAYNQYLLARQFYERGNLDGFRRAVEAYRKAIDFDPGYAAAYAGLAMSEFFVGDRTGDAAALQQARAAADKAEELAPGEADGYMARGYLRFNVSSDWSGAQADFQKALALDPSDSTIRRRYGILLSGLGRLPEAIAAMHKATELDPLSSPAWSNLGALLCENGEFAASREAVRRALEIQPESIYALNTLGKLELREGKPAEALATFGHIGDGGFRLSGIAIAEHTLGHAKKSQQALDELLAKDAHDAAYEIAQVYAWRGDKDKAFEWLERAYQQRDGGLSLFKVDSLLASLRGDARFAAMLRKFGLPE